MDLKALLHNDCNVTAVDALGQSEKSGVSASPAHDKRSSDDDGSGGPGSRHPTFEHDLMENTQYE